MWHCEESIFDDTTMELSRTGFWLIHILGTLAIFGLGLKFGLRKRMTFPGMAFNLLRMLAARR